MILLFFAKITTPIMRIKERRFHYERSYFRMDYGYRLHDSVEEGAQGSKKTFEKEEGSEMTLILFVFLFTQKIQLL